MTPRISSRLPWWRVLLIVLLTVLLAWVLSRQLIIPLQKVIAKRYLARGDSYFVSQQYDAAVDEYNTALRYDPGLNEAKNNQKMAAAVRTDPVTAAPFFVAHNMTSAIQLLDEAQQKFSDPKAALTEGVKLYTNREYNYAQYPLLQAVILDPQYPEAWHYSALNFQELAKLDPAFSLKVDAALKKQNALTSKYIVP